MEEIEIDTIPNADYQALSEFRYQIRRFLSASEQMARSAGLETQQHQLLLALRGLPDGTEATIGTLAERLQLQHHSTVELVNRLEQRGFVNRSRGDTDRRQVFVHLTPQGKETLLNLSVAHRTELQSHGPDLVRALITVIGDVSSPEHDRERNEEGAR